MVQCDAAGIAEEQASDEDYDPDDPYGENEYLTDDSIDPDEMTYEVAIISLISRGWRYIWMRRHHAKTWEHA